MKPDKLVIVMVVAGCMGRDSADSKKSPSKYDETAQVSAGRSAVAAAEPPMEDDESGGGGEAMALEEGKMGKKDAADRAEGQYKMRAAEKEVRLGRTKNAPETKKPAAPSDDAPASGEETATRAWFPETFLFEPLVVTDDNGEATVPVHVPDRLTTWRVLALAHARNGAQGGATTSFLGTLPTYVDPVIPGFLIRGDKVRLPIQLVNTTEQAVTGKLETVAEGADVTGGNGAKTVPAQGNAVEYATLSATQAGTIKLGVKLAGTDAVVRAIDVLPSGKPVNVTRSGTLAAPRELSITGPADSDPTTDRARLLVFPGALALLRSELGVSTARAGVAEDAYALLLAGKAPALLRSLGDKPDPDVLRELSLVTAQRAIRHGRTLDVTRASLIAEAALAHPDNPVLGRLGERAVAYLAQQQRPDGTFSGATGWTLQRVLVATADGTRAASANLATAAARQRAQGVQAKARGAFARTFAQVSDGYTAAAILASGAIPESDDLAGKLRERVAAAIKASDDGAKYLDVDAHVVRADGARPSRAEATALAVLALASTKDAKDVTDLGTTLLGAYSPVWGWGDGVANLACMRAVLQLFKNPLPPSVKISLAVDGKPVASGEFNSDRLKDVLALDGLVPGGFSGAHTWTISAEPAVPGLGYSLALQAYVPWPTQKTTQGLELALPAKLDGAVGKPTEIPVQAIAPAGREITLRHALPAGVQVDRPSLEALVSAGTITRFEAHDGKVEIVYTSTTTPLNVKYKVIPTLAGTLRSAASTIETGSSSFFVPPTEWTIR